MLSGARFLIVALLLGGATLVIVGISSPEWMRDASGYAGIYSVCGLRHVDQECRVGAGVDADRQKLFPDSVCGQYTGTRALVVIMSVFSYIAAAVILSQDTSIFVSAGVNRFFVGPIMGGAALTLAMLSSMLCVVIFAIFVEIPSDDGVTQTGPGYHLLVSAWCLLFFAWVAWIASLGSTNARNFLTGYTGTRLMNFWIIAALLIGSSTVQHLNWVGLRIREDLVTPPDFLTIGNEIHGILNIDPDATGLEPLIERIADPPPPSESPVKSLSLGLWSYSLCYPYSNTCEWEGATFLRGSPCLQFVFAQIFGWITFVGAVALTITLAVMDWNSTPSWIMITVFSAGIGVTGSITTALFSYALEPLSPGGNLGGSGFIMFFVGILVVCVTGVIGGGLRIAALRSQTTPSDPDYELADDED